MKNKVYIGAYLYFTIIFTLYSQDYNLDFENGVEGWDTSGNAFTYQPTFGDNVVTKRVRPEMEKYIGGDYWWGVSHPIGHHGSYWIGTFEKHPLQTNFGVEKSGDTVGNSATGKLVSKNIVVSGRFLTFLLGGNGGRVEILFNDNVVRVVEPKGIEIMSRTCLDLDSLNGRMIKIKILDDRIDGHINVDDFIFINDTNSFTTYNFTVNYSEPKKTYQIKYYNNRDTGIAFHFPMWGFADTHAHWMNNVGFGGNLVHGLPYGPIEIALNKCSEHHSEGKLDDAHKFLNGFETGELAADHLESGYPDFSSWPSFKTKTHQSMYIDWVERAYWGGLRVLVCQMSNNEPLADVMGNVSGFKDLTAVQLEVNQLRSMVAENSDWMEIAKSSEDVKRINLENKLAIIIGMEIDIPNNWAIEEAVKQEDLKKYVNDIYYNWDVRYYFPVHIADNAFGGFALYGSEHFCVSNAYLHRGLKNQYVNVISNSQVEFALGRQTGIWRDIRFHELAARGDYKPPPGNYIIRFVGKSDYSEVVKGHINKLGLTGRGTDLVTMLMQKGMIIDVDHMGFKTVDSVLSIAESHHYPLIAGHTNFFGQMLTTKQTSKNDCGRPKLKNEHAKTDAVLSRISKLGGMISPITEGDKDVEQFIPMLIKNNNPGSTKTWAQTYLYALSKNENHYVALGTDFNGFATEISPRFGTYSAYSIYDDDIRKKILGNRRELADKQSNGVKYTTYLQDTRAHKFLGKNVYSEPEKDILHAIFAGYSDIDVDNLGLELSCKGLTLGIRDALDSVPVWKFDYSSPTGGPDLFKIGGYVYVSHKLGFNYGYKDFKRVSKQDFTFAVNRIKPMFTVFENTIGDNFPLKRSIIDTKDGPRDFDFNIDGLAHYGLLPDFFQDLKNIGLNASYLTPLFNSAYNFMRMWSKCEEMSKNVK
jgi:microsomal dipeptidase-like Zn-dependent dipeptidase